ncbi:hypothetical protein HK097_008718 [Rhizophlyctis rosea]|uniref:Uncharacterized protein n=1 Tax=Rhizophlyctis rosea TaxID=64517 RepID=A0AAD5SI05_9FUNG|nr:hypothetical protein HK097_008718 [Rhizophlyctis rosea]
MRPYERIPLGDEPEGERTVLYEARPSLDDSTPQSSSSGTPPPFTSVPGSFPSSDEEPSSSRPRPLPFQTRGSDGVFANLSAKPEAPTTSTKAFQEIEPPSYADVVQSEPPPFYETTVFSTIGEDGEVLIDGLPVGNYFAFFINMFISMSFDFIGFLLTTLMATSHAARCGSRSGLGFTLIRYALYIRTAQYEKDVEDYQALYDPENPETPEQIQAENEWMSWLLLAAGFVIILRSNADYIRARRMQDIVLTPSPSPV